MAEKIVSREAFVTYSVERVDTSYDAIRAQKFGNFRAKEPTHATPRQAGVAFRYPGNGRKA